uniref:Uncharacterized protein n=1 Tax=Chromera velia CCMP2878 TaxID=1169474 RepID=A0A0G4F635_9ALVE|eukprot:Cvel_15209.t1-p1 / transcript=Cvel_15209.t1 / gene=Cvel_15209 / organism=Chromera_velia_CCMP2878 / gene_product=hypothetical protein / transcript_product=hypothetical protein / location=Cvel_scaffold1112:47186-49128(-) / protein_length=493 / sequence_SO=supercontig / SO=protein_coding / is_pseudo=false
MMEAIQQWRMGDAAAVLEADGEDQNELQDEGVEFEVLSRFAVRGCPAAGLKAADGRHVRVVHGRAEAMIGMVGEDEADYLLGDATPEQQVNILAQLLRIVADENATPRDLEDAATLLDFKGPVTAKALIATITQTAAATIAQSKDPVVSWSRWEAMAPTFSLQAGSGEGDHSSPAPHSHPPPLPPTLRSFGRDHRNDAAATYGDGRRVERNPAHYQQQKTGVVSRPNGGLGDPLFAPVLQQQQQTAVVPRPNGGLGVQWGILSSPPSCNSNSRLQWCRVPTGDWGSSGGSPLRPRPATATADCSGAASQRGTGGSSLRPRPATATEDWSGAASQRGTGGSSLRPRPATATTDCGGASFRDNPLWRWETGGEKPWAKLWPCFDGNASLSQQQTGIRAAFCRLSGCRTSHLLIRVRFLLPIRLCWRKRAVCPRPGGGGVLPEWCVETQQEGKKQGPSRAESFKAKHKGLRREGQSLLDHSVGAMIRVCVCLQLVQ